MIFADVYCYCYSYFVSTHLFLFDDEIYFIFSDKRSNIVSFFPFLFSINMKFSTVASILFGVGFQIHEGYADANFTSFQIEEIKNISRTEVKNVKKILKRKIKKLEKKNKNLEAQLKGIEESLAFTCAGDTCQGRNDYNFIISTALIIGKINPKCSYGSPSLLVDGNGSNCPSGSGAVSFGRRTISSGKGSFTAGFDVVASGSFSTVIGQSLITQPPTPETSQLPTPETSQLPTPQITQSPCPDSVVLNDNNAKEKLSDYSGNKEVIRCFDTSKVTNMKNLFQDTGINADLSSWDVASVTNMDVSCQSLQYQL